MVRDYDEAIAFYRDKLSFEVVADEYQAGQDKRWVLVRPPGAGRGATTVLFARASTDEQMAIIGNQSGGRVFLFLKTDDIWRDYRSMISKGVKFVREPKAAPYGIVAVFSDLYGNRWDLIEFAAAPD